MRSLGGLVLLSGIGVALFVNLRPRRPRVVRSTSCGALSVCSARAIFPALSRVTPAVRLGAFSPSIALATPPAAFTPVTTEAPSGWQTTVAVTAPAPAVLPKTLSPTDPDARYKLVLDIQQQLKRVGCYWGRLDGSWEFGTKDAMKDFTNRVNATLPLDQPDYVQLTLIQSHGEETCGACPAGQSLSTSGRCVGPPITAQAKQTNAPQVMTAQKEVLPWKATSAPDAAGGQPLFKPMPTTVVSSEPLPGRMAIGASVTASVVSQHSGAPVLPGAAAVPPGAAAAALDPNAGAVKPPVVDHSRGFAGDAPPRRAQGYRSEEPGTPRYNLLLSLGGLY